MGGSVLRWVPNITRVSTHIAAFDMDGTLIKTKTGIHMLWYLLYSRGSSKIVRKGCSPKMPGYHSLLE